MIYRIDALNELTGVKYTEYWFSWKVAKRLQFLYAEDDTEVLGIYKCNFSWKLFKKCLTD